LIIVYKYQTVSVIDIKKEIKNMNVLSLFDGISCGKLALKKAGIKVENYYASEIKEIAISVSNDNHKDIQQLGDIKNWKNWDIKNIDLIIFGSPCQDLSIAMKNRKGLQGINSNLFYTALDILNFYKPKYFLMENVARMSKDNNEIITKLLKVEPVRINSKLLSGQLRDRLYWTNIPNVTIPKDKNIQLQSILTNGYTDREKSRAILVSESRPLKDQYKMYRRYSKTGFTTIVFNDSNFDYTKGIRYFNQQELEKLQTLPLNYTKILNRNKAANVIGDAWTVDVITHILKKIKDDI